MIRRAGALAVGGALVGSVAGALTISIVTSAGAQTTGAPSGVLDVTHLPTLLRAEGDPRELVYEAHCAAAGVEDPETACALEGSVFLRAVGAPSFEKLPLEWAGGSRLVATVPDALSSASAFEYYAVVESPDAAARQILPAGGAAAPTVSRRLAAPVNVSLGRHRFAGSLARGERVAEAAWGKGALEIGLEAGPNAQPSGASSFDVDAAGSIVMLDHAGRKLLRWRRAGGKPERVPVSTNGTIADVAATGDGSIYVLETTARDGRHPLVRRFDADGRELDAVEAAERGPAQILKGPDGPLVLQRPSHQWMPAVVSGVPASPAAQRRRGRDGRPVSREEEIVVQRTGRELRLAIVERGSVKTSWRVRSETALGEVQLAQPVGGRLVVVVRVYSDTADEFAVLVLDRRGLRSRTAVAPVEWAEGAPFARFRLAGPKLYRLGSSPSGVFIDRFDVEVRP